MEQAFRQGVPTASAAARPPSPPSTASVRNTTGTSAKASNIATKRPGLASLAAEAERKGCNFNATVLTECSKDETVR